MVGTTRLFGTPASWHTHSQVHCRTFLEEKEKILLPASLWVPYGVWEPCLEPYARPIESSQEKEGASRIPTPL